MTAQNHSGQWQPLTERPGEPGAGVVCRLRTGERSVDSIAWKINSEIVLLLGWNPAILLQVAHPLVAAGVMDHSLFLTDPAGRARRLWRTLNVMFDLTFGLPDEVQRAADAINAVHDRVHGELRQAAGPFEAGHGYSAHDPELLRWVHCTMLEVFPAHVPAVRGAALGRGVGPLLRRGEPGGAVAGRPGWLPAEQPAGARAYMREMLASGADRRQRASRGCWPTRSFTRACRCRCCRCARSSSGRWWAAAAASAGGVRVRLGLPPREPDA